jgi:hypothetical protein
MGTCLDRPALCVFFWHIDPEHSDAGQWCDASLRKVEGWWTDQHFSQSR